jgi:crotonobetainyl-CoA:carnitine CoA-transferase CaiB-like acyl-CoA transferase
VPGVLDGIKVVELSAFAFGPLAGMMLADLGADVVKVEPPHGDPSRSSPFMIGSVDCRLPHGLNALFESNNRNKRSVVLDLKVAADRATMLELLGRADVFIHNYRQGVPERLGIGYEDVRRINPGLIYAAASGYGPAGPDVTKPGLDFAGQARSGLMWSAGHPGDPPYYSTGGTADMIGAIVLAYGVLAALLGRRGDSEGQKIDVSHLGASMWLQNWALGVSLYTNLEDWPRFDRGDAGNPLWNHYACADGRWIALALLDSQRHWATLLEVLGLGELQHDDRFVDVDARRLNNKALIAILDEAFGDQPGAYWAERLSRHPDLLWDFVQSLRDLPSDPQVVANGYLQEREHPALGPVTVQAPPVTFSRTGWELRRFAPGLGEHTEEVLQQWGIRP